MFGYHWRNFISNLPWIREIRAYRKIVRQKIDSQRKYMARFDYDSTSLPKNPMYTKPIPPKICCVCKEPGVSFIPTTRTLMAYVMNPMLNLWSRDKEVIEFEFAQHYARFDYKWFCRTHKLGFHEERFKV